MSNQSFAKKLETNSSKKLLDSKENNATTSHGRTPPSLYRYLGNQATNRLMETTEDKESQHQDHSDNQGTNPEDNLNEIMPVLRKQYGVSEPDDPVEKEATSVASQIVNMEPSADNAQMEVNNDMRIWRSPIITRKQETSQDAHSAVDLDLPTSDGLPLERNVAAYMEPRFGYSFEDVRIHTSSQSAELSHELNARAFATGKDIYFGHGEYNPETKDGKQLIAHELTHVVQQGQASQINNTTISRTKKEEPKKTVTVNITKLHESTGSPDSALTYANTKVYNQADVEVKKGKDVTIDEPNSKKILGEDLILKEYADPASPTDEEKALFKENQTKDAVTMYFVKGLSADSLGEALWPSTGTGLVGVVVGNTRPDNTFSHELGHVLLDNGSHNVPDDTYLMHATAPDPTKLTPEQIEKIKKSGFVK